EGGVAGGHPRSSRGRDAPAPVRRDDTRAAAAGPGLPRARRLRLGRRDAAEAVRLLRRGALGAEEEERAEQLLGIHEDLYAAFRMMRDEVLGSVAQVGAGMSELRLDAHLDAVQAVARYMDLIKLACLIERRPREEELAGAIAEINQVLSHVASSEQREVFLGSNLDALLLDSERDNLRRRELIAERTTPSLESYLPIRGPGLMLS